ncbi:MAG: hypothetical protein AAF666_00455 [Pseudomonadota bacterium]
MARLRILAIAGPDVTAPAGLWFEAVDLDGFDLSDVSEPEGTYDPSFHAITYVWQVKGAPLAPFDAPENMVPAWRDANRAYGKQVAFFFPEPGTYEVELWARDRSGNEARATESVVVADPSLTYPEARTVCASFDPAETWVGAPPECQTVETPRALLEAVVRADKPLRVLFKRGQTYALPTIDVRGQKLGLVDAWGNGAQPVLRAADDGSWVFKLGKRSRVEGFSVANLAFQGTWDATTETGRSTRSPLHWTRSSTPCHHTVWNCRFSGFDHLDFEIKKDTPGTVLVGNCHVTNWRNYGFLLNSPKTRFALVGMAVAQDADALHGGPKRGQLSNGHGPVRIANCSQVYLGVCDVFSRTGWSGLAKERADQPCLRLNTSAVRGSAYNLDRVVCEGGFHPVSFDAANKRKLEVPGNYVIDKALIIGTAKTIGPFVVVDLGGVTIRNMVAILPDAPRKHPNRWQGVVRTDMDNPAPDNTDVPLALYGISALNLLSSENAQGEPWDFHKGNEVFQNYTQENVLLHEGAAGDSGLDLTMTFDGIHPRFRGIRYGFTPQTGNFTRHIQRGDSFVVPYAEITEDQPGVEGTPATDQAYWQAHAAEDRWHMLFVQGLRSTLRATDGDFAVTFEQTGVRVTNTGRTAWPAEARWTLKLDRTSRLPKMDLSFASPRTLPVPLPHPDRHKSAGGTLPFDDFFGRPRGETPSAGAVEPF